MRIFKFKPKKSGLGKVLGDLEAEVMEAVWGKGRCTVREIYEELRLRRKIAYTTVMTIMSRLAEKNLLLREKVGVAFFYSPALSREQFNREVSSAIIAGLLDGFGRDVFAQLVDEADKSDPGALAELERLIAERRNKE